MRALLCLFVAGFGFSSAGFYLMGAHLFTASAICSLAATLLGLFGIRASQEHIKRRAEFRAIVNEANQRMDAVMTNQDLDIPEKFESLRAIAEEFGGEIITQTSNETESKP